MVRPKYPKDRYFCAHLCLGLQDECLSTEIVLNKYFILSCIRKKILFNKEARRCVVDLDIFNRDFKKGYDLDQLQKIHSSEFQIGNYRLDSFSWYNKIYFIHTIENPIVFTSIPSDTVINGLIIVENINSSGFTTRYVSNEIVDSNKFIDDILYLAFPQGDYSLTIYKKFIASTIVVSNRKKTRLPLDSSKQWTVITQIQHINENKNNLVSILEKIGSDYFVTLASLKVGDTGFEVGVVGYLAIEISNDEFDNIIGEIDAYGLFYATFKTELIDYADMDYCLDYKLNVKKTTNDLKNPSIIKTIKLNSIRNNLNVDNSENIILYPKYIFGNVEFGDNAVKTINNLLNIHIKNVDAQAFNNEVIDLTICPFNASNLAKYDFYISGLYIEDYKQVVLKRVCLSIKPSAHYSFINCYKLCKRSRDNIYCPPHRLALDCLRDYVKPNCTIGDESTYSSVVNEIHKNKFPFFKKAVATATDTTKNNLSMPLPPIIEEKSEPSSPLDKNTVISIPEIKNECIYGEWSEWGLCSSICYENRSRSNLGELDSILKNEYAEYRIKSRPLYYKPPNKECLTIAKSKCVDLKSCSEICSYRLNSAGEALIFIWSKACEKLNLKLPETVASPMMKIDSKLNINVDICEFDQIWSICDAPCAINDTLTYSKPMEYVKSPLCEEGISRLCNAQLYNCPADTIQTNVYLERAIFRPNDGGWVNERTMSCHCQYDDDSVEVATANELYFSGPDKYLGFQYADGNPRDNTSFFGIASELNDLYPHNTDRNNHHLNSMASLKSGIFIEFPTMYFKHVGYNMKPKDKRSISNFCATGSTFIKPVETSLLNIDCNNVRPAMRFKDGMDFIKFNDEYSKMFKTCRESCDNSMRSCYKQPDMFQSMKFVSECVANLIGKEDVEDFEGKCEFLSSYNPNKLLMGSIAAKSQDICASVKTISSKRYDLNFCYIICNKYFNVCLSSQLSELREEELKCLKKSVKANREFAANCEFISLSESVIRGNGLVFCKFKPVDCGYSEWSEWSECDRNIRKRSRKILSGAKNFGRPCLGNHENLNQEEICDTIRADAIIKPAFSPSITKDEYNSRIDWDVNAEIARLVGMYKGQGEYCEIFPGQRGIDEFKLIIDIGKCSCPQGYKPCDLPESFTNKNWLSELHKLCNENPLAFILFNESELFDSDVLDNQVENRQTRGWKSISSFHFSCHSMSFVKHDYETLKRLCTSMGDVTYLSCTTDDEWILTQRRNVLISTIGFLCTGMFAGIIFVSYVIISRKQKRPNLVSKNR